MADAPLLFGKAGRLLGPDVRFREGHWHWRHGVVEVELEPEDGRWYGYGYFDGEKFFTVSRARRAPCLRAIERELTRLAAGLDAMGVPRG